MILVRGDLKIKKPELQKKYTKTDNLLGTIFGYNQSIL